MVWRNEFLVAAPDGRVVLSTGIPTTDLGLWVLADRSLYNVGLNASAAAAAAYPVMALMPADNGTLWVVNMPEVGQAWKWLQMVGPAPNSPIVIPAH